MTANWKIFTGSLTPHDRVDELPDPPPWRPFRRDDVVGERRLPNGGDDEAAPFDRTDRGRTFRCSEKMVEMVNAALYLRRPLLITGKPGSGKSSLIYAVARELRLGPVLRWSITSRSTLHQGLYEYDAIARLQDTQMHPSDPDGPPPEIGKYLKLGPLGTALLPTHRPWALLVDEIDKADIDLPSDLLNILEEGEYEIPELKRLDQDEVRIRSYLGDETFKIVRGRVRCHQFPFIVLTNNGEREFSPPFLRRCLQLHLEEPDEALLAEIVKAHLGEEVAQATSPLITDFLSRRMAKNLATDQLLNAVYMVAKGGFDGSDQRAVEALLSELSVFSAA